ncbi:hypothetical protein [Roseomonas sp. BN140053]|uniref:hypothetical protein n=1 Tax=Roseomonas sp. BN140053 TaxID=3391898 RepID=UPI0039E8A03E
MLGVVPRAADLLVLNQPAQLSAVIEKMRGGPIAFAVPLIAAALAGDLRVLVLSPGGRAPVRLLDHACPPTVVVLGGDPGPRVLTPGPEAFPQARRLLAWSAYTMLHASGGQEEHYSAVVEAARLVRRVLLVETATDQEDAWRELLQAETDRRGGAGRHLPSLIISARDRGGVHPVKEGSR